MKIDFTVKGEIKDKDLPMVREYIEKIKNIMIWYKHEFKFEELKQQ